MAIQFQCPTCNAVVKVPDSAAGKIGRCPKCDKRVQIPTVAPPTAPAVVPAAAPFVPPLPDFDAPAAVGPGPLLGDKSTVFVLPPSNAIPIGPPLIGPPPEPVAPPPPTVEPANPAAAREEYDTAKAWLTKPFVPGAGWPPALRAVIHFTKAARLDPKNADYATHAGIAGCLSIDRFLESWGKGPLTSIAAFHLDQPLGKQVDNTEKLFRPSGLSEENLELIRSQANDALHWFQQALALDPEDSITRCRRAELLMNLGAFPLALADAKAVLSSPLVTSKTRESAQRVADFILEDDSPVRKFLTRTQAQQLSPPTGIVLPKPVTKASTPPATTTQEIPFAINTAGGPAAFSAATALAPTVAEEMPLFGSASPATAPARSVAARLKEQRRGNWAAIAIPLVLGLLLVGIGGGYLYFTRVQFVANLSGEDLGQTTLRKPFFANEFGLPEDKLALLTSTFRDAPETIRSQMRVMTVRGSAQGLEVSIRPGEGSRLVRVDLRSHPPLQAFTADKTHATALEAPLAKLRMAKLQKFGSDFATSQAAGMQMGNLGDYLDSLGGDLLVRGLGYHVEASTPEKVYPCIFEDESGAIYFPIPQGVASFEVVPRAFEGQPEGETVFGKDFKYSITISPPVVTAPAAATSAAAPEPSPVSPTAPDAAPAN